MADFNERYEGPVWPPSVDPNLSPQMGLQQAITNNMQLEHGLQQQARQLRPPGQLESLIRALLGY